jgi:amino acid adenylation domain-containing protein/non-ribosomal peptide synthase protein (TIGR01720 family)
MKPKSHRSSQAVPRRDKGHSTLVDLLRFQADRLGHEIAYTVLDEDAGECASLTYRELFTRAGAIAARLQERNLKGERAILFYPPGLDYITAFFGCLNAGVVSIPAFPPRASRKNERLTAIIKDAGTAVALTVSGAKRKAEAYLCEEFGEKTIPVESTDDVPDVMATGFREYNPAPKDLAYLQYTSGSTASPKGVMISHGNVLSNLAYIDDGFEHDEKSVSVTWLPHFHDMGLVDGLLMPLYRGFRGLIMAPASFLRRPILWLEAITRYGVTHSGGPNFAYDLCARKTTVDQREGLDLRSWVVAYSGAEPIRRDVLEHFAREFAPYGFSGPAFYPAYGLAEATLKVSGGRKSGLPVYCAVAAEALEHNKVIVTTGDAEGARQMVGCGGIAGSTSVVIVEPATGVESEPDRVGEIWVSGPGVAKGFWNRPEESDQVFRAFTSATNKGPYLRTGDLGFIRDNELYITGRLNDLIIIRGRNIYPQDIEATAGRSHRSLRAGGGAAFTIDEGAEPGVVVVHELESRKAEAPDDIMAAIRQAVAETHEVQVRSIALLKPGALPRTSSGKAQRKLCRQMFLARKLDAVAEWAVAEAKPQYHQGRAKRFCSDDAEDVPLVLRQIIAARLDVDEADISMDEPLSRYGLDSLASIEIAHTIETKLNSTVPMAALLADSSIRELSADISSRARAADVQSGRIEAPVRAEYALSRGQQALWFIYNLDPLSAAYNMAGAVGIKSGLNVESLRRAFQVLVGRHECLRTVFREVGGVPYQRSINTGDVCFDVRDACEWSDDILRNEVEEEARRPFDLETGPVFRATLYRTAPDRNVLLIAVHHIVADFWSLSVLIDELGKLYGEDAGATLEDLPKLTGSYAEYVERQKRMLDSATGEEHLKYWKRQLEGVTPSLGLPLDKARPRFQTFRGGAVPLCIKADLPRSFARAHRTTSFVTLLAVFQLLLCKYSGQDDVVIGTPTSGRTSPDFAGVAGYFVNSVVIRAIIGPRDSFSDRAGLIRKSVLEAFYHEEYPFPDIVKRLNVPVDPSRSPLFQAMFGLQKAHLDPSGGLAAISLGDPQARVKVGALELSGFTIEHRIAQFDLSMTTAEYGDEIKALLEYNSDLFERATIERMGAHYLTLLSRVLSQPSASVSNISYTSDGERHQLLGEWVDNPGDPHEFLAIHRVIERNARSIPDAVAVVEGDFVLTYGELVQRAARLCGYLRLAGVRRERSAVLLVERSPEMAIAMLAVLKAGGAYVPIDPSTPESRLNSIIEDVQPAAVLAHSNLADKVAGQGFRTIQIDRDLPGMAGRQDPGPEPDTHEDDVCYIIYTSGSTGVPKGVAVRHVSLAQYIRSAAGHYGMGNADRVLQFAALSFDASADEIWCALVSGACLVIHRDAGALPAVDLARFCNERMITLLSLPTSYWHAMVSTLSREEWESAGSVRLTVIGGEGALSEKMERWSSVTNGRIRLVNSYGPTETTIGVCCWSPAPVNSGRPGCVPIGRPITGSLIRVLDIHGQLSGAGVVGEIGIGGAGLARGYLNDPGKTAERFVPDGFSALAGDRLYRSGDLGRYAKDGNLECLGRLDRQAKIRGYRIELAEVESALCRSAAVKESAVAAVDDSRGNKRLAAYIVLNNGASRDPNILRDSLRDFLPPYMIPSHFIFLDELPKNAAGKVDRRLLAATKTIGGPDRQPERGLRTSVEQKIAEVWSRVLGVPDIGPDDNFFEIGGDSILSLQAAGAAREYGIVVTPKQIFENPTVRSLAAEARSAAASVADGPADAVTPVIGSGSEPDPLMPIQRWFFECEFKDAHHWNMAVMLGLKEKLSLEVISAAFTSLAKRHGVLRSTFAAESGQWFQRPASGREPQVREVDVTGLPASEGSAVIHSTIEIEQRGLDLANGPVVRSVLFKAGDGEQDRLLIVVHHLIADAVSLRILIGDLERLCAGFGEESCIRPDQVPAVEAGQLAAELERLAEAGCFQNEVEKWERLKNASVGELPVDFAGANLEGTCTTIATRLDERRTGELTKTASKAYRAKVDELLVGALAEALCEWSGGEAALIELERHGRVINGIDLDLTRSIGWFTATFPLLVHSGWDSAGRRSGVNDSVRWVKDSLKQVPGDGIGFGVLRYLIPDSKTRDEIRALPRPQVSFNYLGDLDLLLGGRSLFDSVEIVESGTRSGKAARPHLLEVDAGIKDARLEVRWRFSSEIFKRETIDRLARSFADHLLSLIERAIAGKAVSYSATDFELVTLSQSELERLPGSDTTTIEDIYPLSPSQQGMLFHAVSSDKEDDYAGTLLLSLTGKLEAAAFEEAWRAIVRRHSIFRTSFVWQEISEPLQIVHTDAELSIKRLDWTGVPQDSVGERLDRLTAEERSRGFELSAAPLMRIWLIRVSDERHLLVVCLHHLIIDGWSLPLLLEEALEACAKIAAGGEPPAAERASSFGSYIAWLRRQDREAAENFWREELNGVTGAPELAISRPRVGGTCDESTSRRRVRLSASLTARLAFFARKNGLTLSTTVQGAWAVLLARYSGQADVTFGTVTAGRPESLSESNKIIGPFSATLPARARMSGEEPLREWLAEFQERQAEARRYEYSSLIDIQGWSTVPRARPLFNSVIAFENYPLDEKLLAGSSGLKVELIESAESTNYPLTVIVVPGDHLSIEIVYRARLFDDSAIERMLTHFETLLSGFEMGGIHPISAIPMLAPAERDEILCRWSGHATEYEREKPIAALLREQVELCPDSVAIVCNDQQVSYAELYRRAGAAAARLTAIGLCPEKIAGITTERSIETIIGIVAIVLSGAAYLPIDSSNPKDRVKSIVSSAGARLILTSFASDNAFQESSARSLPLSEISGPAAASCEAGHHQPREQDLPGAENLAYVMYTSGSTGVPKGIAITNRGVVRLVRNTSYLDFSADDIFLQSSTLAFDASTFEIWGALLNGARLVIMPGATPSPAEIGAILKNHQVTTAWFTAGLFHLMVQDRIEDLSRVKRILAGGDVVSVEDAQALSIHAPGCTLINGYGPTESTTFTTTYECRDRARGRAVLPIGRPISNTFVYILSDDMNAAPTAIAGEIYIGGDGLARCYVGAADLTAEKFVPSPFGGQGGQRLYRSGDLAKFEPDGNIEFMGRRDRQIKLRGFRIEPLEVEAKLAAHSGIKQCAVVAFGDAPADKSLVAYLAAAGGKEIEADELRDFLRASLPDYMVPAQFLFMDSLPLTPNGKIDRRNLPAPDRASRPSSNGYVAPGSAVEKVLAGVWEATLGRERVGIRDDFFALGGHSLSAMRVISSIRYIFKIDLPVSKIFERPTIEGVARALETAEPSPGQIERIARIVERIKRMSPEEKAQKLGSRSQQSV